jgi:alpha-tubulin suppressor-like RCC1 family protein
MRARSFLTLGVFFLLAGCGTLRINIDYGNTSVPRSTDTLMISTSTSKPSLTPISTVTQTVTETKSPNPTESQNGVVAVAAGNSHTCALTASGRVKCWGNNENGQLGNGTMVNSAVPVDVTGLTDAKAITAGWRHTCVLTAGGGVKCWGYNRNGELGNGSTEDSSRPSDVKDLSAGVAAIDAGDNHTCAVTASGGVKCWGYNDYGQLGDGTKSSRSVPVDSAGFSGGVAEVAAGWGHTCVRTNGGGAKCWGDNENGQLGDGETVAGRLSPVDATGLTYGVLKITADGGQTCALTTGGGVSCWGNNKYGQLGDGSNQQRNVPVQVIGLTAGVSNVEVGWNHACAVVSGGLLECWGWNYFGQLGDGTKITQSKPAHVYRLTDGVRDIAVGSAYACVATDLGAVKCWGQNNYGQLGDGTQSDSLIPLTVVGLGAVPVAVQTFMPTSTQTSTNTTAPTFTGALAIDAGMGGTCALTANHGVKCWGDNVSGQLGDGSTYGANLPVDVSGLSHGIKSIALGRFHTCAITAENIPKCWGLNIFGQLGDGSTVNSLRPLEVGFVTGDIRSIALGGYHTCALTYVAVVECWGWNQLGQLGDGTNTDSKTPVGVVGLIGDITAISSRQSSTCALNVNGWVRCWGNNEFGQLGDGTTVNRNYPVDVVGLTSRVAAVSLGDDHACVLMASGGVKCWGNNEFGQLGDGTTTDRRTPVDVAGLDGVVVEVKAGYKITCARMNDGRVKCWGLGKYGALGPSVRCPLNSFCSESKPVDIAGISTDSVSLAVGGQHVCILTITGHVKCWGWNYYGQLGDGTNEDRFEPVEVVGL